MLTTILVCLFGFVVGASVAIIALRIYYAVTDYLDDRSWQAYLKRHKEIKRRNRQYYANKSTSQS